MRFSEFLATIPVGKIIPVYKAIDTDRTKSCFNGWLTELLVGKPLKESLFVQTKLRTLMADYIKFHKDEFTKEWTEDDMGLVVHELNNLHMKFCEAPPEFRKQYYDKAIEMLESKGL